jgi:hypothetical protein
MRFNHRDTEGHGGFHQIDQRRPRSRAVSASAVEMGLRRSALRSNLEKALRPAGSSMGRLSRCASARAARRTNELRVSPALRAAASMTWRSVSGNETRTLRIPIVYLTDIRRGWSFLFAPSRLRVRSMFTRRREDAKRRYPLSGGCVGSNRAPPSPERRVCPPFLAGVAHVAHARVGAPGGVHECLVVA